jgi:adenosylhomocysteine nucleosidase
MRLLGLLLLFSSLAYGDDKILILGAVPQEIVPLVQALQNHQKETVDGVPCDLGKIGTHDVVIAITGVGKTNSAMVTTIMLTHYRPTIAFMTGTAARIRRTIRTGDIVIASDVSFHDAGSLTANGMVQGKLDSNGKLASTLWFSPTGEKTNPFLFPDTPELVAYAQKIAEHYKPEPVTLDGNTYQPIIKVGPVTSGDLSGVTEVKIADIKAKIDPDLMEMESAGFSQVCQFFKIPHLVIRSGSNWAEERNNDDYLRLSPIAARHAALFTEELVRDRP